MIVQMTQIITFLFNYVFSPVKKTCPQSRDLGSPNEFIILSIKIRCVSFHIHHLFINNIIFMYFISILMAFHRFLSAQDLIFLKLHFSGTRSVIWVLNPDRVLNSPLNTGCSGDRSLIIYISHCSQETSWNAPLAWRWLTDRLTDGWTDRLIDWLIDGRTDGQADKWRRI